MHKSVRHGDGALEYTILPQESEEGDWGAAGGSPKKKKCPPRTVITAVLFLFVIVGILMAVLVPMYLNGSESRDGNIGPAPFGDLGQAGGGEQNMQGNVMVLPSPDTNLVTTISYDKGGTENPELEGKTPAPSEDKHNRPKDKEKVTPLPPEHTTTTEKHVTKEQTTTEATTESNIGTKLSKVPTTEHTMQTPSTSTQEYKSELQDLFNDDLKKKKGDKQNETAQESTTEINTPTTKASGEGHATKGTSSRDDVKTENYTVSPVKGHDSDRVKVTETNEEKNEDQFATPANKGEGGGGFFSSVQLGMKDFDYQDYIAIAVVGSFTIILLIVTGVCFILHRRKKKRTRRRKAVGKMVTDLQSGDNVMLLTGSSEEE